MRFEKRLRFLLAAVMAIAAAAGCQMPYRSRPVAIEVRDAETKQPLPTAEVRFSDPLTQPSTTLVGPGEKTDPNGVARLEVTPNGLHDDRFQVSASGYQPYFKLVSDKELQEISPAGFFEKVETRPPNYVVELYSGEPFGVDIVLPLGYHGLIKVKVVKPKREVPCPIGQRRFTFVASPPGELEITGPSVIQNVPIAAYRGRYADGTPLDNRMETNKVAFRWIKHDEDFDYFVTGTLEEWNRYRRQFYPPEEDPFANSNRGNTGSGNGGGHRRGGGAGAGPSAAPGAGPSAANNPFQQ